MKMEGYVKAGELNSIQRKALGQADFMYSFARDRFPAMFFDRDRVKQLKRRSEPPIALLDAESIVSRFEQFGWTPAHLEEYGQSAVMMLDPDRKCSIPVKVYRQDLIESVRFNPSELPAIAQQQETEQNTKVVSMAGRKSNWNHSKTQLIRIPEEFVEQILSIARRLDNGEVLEVNTISQNPVIPTMSESTPTSAAKQKRSPKVKTGKAAIDSLQPGLDKQISAAAAPAQPKRRECPAWVLEVAEIWKDPATPKFKPDPEYPYATGTRSPFTPDRAEREAAMMQGRDPQFNVGRIHLDRLGGGVKRKLSGAETSDRTQLQRKELLGAYDRMLTSTDPIAVRVQVRNEMLKLKLDRDRDYSNESIYIPRRLEDEQTIRLDCCRWIDPAGLFLQERKLNDLGLNWILEQDKAIAIEYDEDDWFWYEPFQRGYYKPIDPLVYMRHHLVPPFCFERSQQFLVEMFEDGSDHYWLCDRDGVGAMFGV